MRKSRTHCTFHRPGFFAWLMLPAFVIILCCTMESKGQPESVMTQITEQSGSRSETISAFRRLLLDKFLEEDFEMVRNVKSYLLNEQEDNDYAVFYVPELFLLLFWTHEYNLLLEKVADVDYDFFNRFGRQIKPPYDLLYVKLIERTTPAAETMENIVENDPLLQTEEKEFLILLLRYLIAEGNEGENHTLDRTQINSLAENHLKKYPESEQEYFIRHFIRLQYNPSPWGFGVEFFSGYGFFTKTLDAQYSHNIPVGVAFDIYYHNFVFYLRNYIGFNRTREDIIYPDVIWQRKSQVRVFLPEISVGYGLKLNNHLAITPFAGFMATGITATEKDIEDLPALRDAGIAFAPGINTGFNFDISLGQPTQGVNMYGNRTQNHLVLRIRYNWTAPFLNNYPNINGNVHTITVGIASSGRRIIRDI